MTKTMASKNASSIARVERKVDRHRQAWLNRIVRLECRILRLEHWLQLHHGVDKACPECQAEEEGAPRN